MKVILFDIDWTLLRGKNKVHEEAFNFALKKVYGINNPIKKTIEEGMIDSQIILEILKCHKYPKKKPPLNWQKHSN